PGVGHVREHFALEVRVDALLERDTFRVTEIRIRFRAAVTVAADLSRLVAIAKGAEDCLELRSGEAHPRGAIQLAQVSKEGRAILVKRRTVRLREVGEEIADFVLTAFTCLDLFEPSLLVLLAAGREVGKPSFGVELRDALLCRLEVQAQGPLN